MDVSTSTTGDRSNIPHHWGAVGTTASFDRKSPFDRTTAEGSQGQGSRTPSLDAPHRDCSRRRLRPNPDRFGPPLVAGTARFPVRSDVGRGRCRHATRACKARATRGSCDARFPRRNRTLTNPRGLPSPAVRGANGEESHLTGELPGDRFQRLLHHRMNPCEGRSLGA
jgi:hypothetical protein